MTLVSLQIHPIASACKENWPIVFIDNVYIYNIIDLNQETDMLGFPT